MSDAVISRRAVLATGMAGAGAAALAACSSNSTKSQPPAGSATSSTASSPATSSSTTAAPGTSAAEGVAVAKLSSITIGEAVSATVDGAPAIIARPTATTAAAFSAKCTHMGCTVQPAGKELHCPCHGSRYNAVTGAVLQGPAPSPLPKIPVRVVNGEVLVS